MYVYHKNLIYRCKTCGNRIPVSDIDEIYHEQLKSFLLTDVDVNSYMKKSDIEISEKESLLKSTTEEIYKLRKKMDELVNMRIGGDMTRELFLEHHKPLEEQWVKLQDQVPQLEAEISFLRVQYLSSDTVLQDAKTLYHRWPIMPTDEKRTIVEVITESITIGKEDIAIKLAYLPSNFQNAGNSQSLY